MKPLLSSAMVALLFANIGCNKKKEDPPRPASTDNAARSKVLTHVSKSEELANICLGPEKQTHFASAYVKGPTPARVALMVQWGDDAAYEPWNLWGLDAWQPSKPEDVELVVCVKATKLKKAHDCDYTTAKVELYDATYEIVVRDGRDAKEIAKKTYADLNVRDCPDEMTVSYGTTSTKNGPNLYEMLLDLLVPLQPAEPPVPQPEKPNELMYLCENQALTRQAAYAPTPGKTSPLFAFFEGRPGSGVRQAKSKVNPEPAFMDFRDQAPFAITSGKVADYQLVACITGKPNDKVLKKCPFGVGGNVLEIRGGEVEVSVREAKTNKEVAKKSFPAKDGACPETWTFPMVAGQTSETVNLDRKELEAWLKPFVSP